MIIKKERQLVPIAAVAGGLLVAALVLGMLVARSIDFAATATTGVLATIGMKVIRVDADSAGADRLVADRDLVDRLPKLKAALAGADARKGQEGRLGPYEIKVTYDEYNAIMSGISPRYTDTVYDYLDRSGSIGSIDLYSKTVEVEGKTYEVILAFKRQ
jgi:hypothetical protein